VTKFYLKTALDDAICHAKSEELIIPFGIGIGKDFHAQIYFY
jgi:hypothetical protein